MKVTERNWRIGLAVLLAWTCAGCSNGPRLEEVRGVVTLDGKPVSSAAVTFYPQFEGAKQAAGQTDTSGRFELHTFSAGKGVAAGDYKVTVFKSPGADAGEKGAKDPPLPGALGERPRSALPQRYEDVTTTPLRFTVPHTGDLVVELVTSKER